MKLYGIVDNYESIDARRKLVLWVCGGERD